MEIIGVSFVAFGNHFKQFVNFFAQHLYRNSLPCSCSVLCFAAVDGDSIITDLLLTKEQTAALASTCKWILYYGYISIFFIGKLYFSGFCLHTYIRSDEPWCSKRFFWFIVERRLCNMHA